MTERRRFNPSPSSRRAHAPCSVSHNTRLTPQGAFAQGRQECAPLRSPSRSADALRKGKTPRATAKPGLSNSAKRPLGTGRVAPLARTLARRRRGGAALVDAEARHFGGALAAQEVLACGERSRDHDLDHALLHLPELHGDPALLPAGGLASEAEETRLGRLHGGRPPALPGLEDAEDDGGRGVGGPVPLHEQADATADPDGRAVALHGALYAVAPVGLA